MRNLTFGEFEITALSTAAPRIKQADQSTQILAWSNGLASEVGEIMGEMKPHLYTGAAISKEDVLNEAGDCLWYLANLAAACGSSLEEIAELNMQKLGKRHGQSFNPAKYMGEPSND